jgi:hypothetical protein
VSTLESGCERTRVNHKPPAAPRASPLAGVGASLLDPAAAREKRGTREYEQKNENLDWHWDSGGAPTCELAPRARTDEDL